MNNIRLMEEKDIPFIQRVAKESWADSYEGMIPSDIQEAFLKEAYSTSYLKIRMKSSLMIISEKEGVLTGFANFSEINGGACELFAIYLLPEAQGRGIGTILLKEGLVRLREVKQLFVNVEKENLRAKRFYDARGFKVIKEFEEDFKGHKLQTIRMMKG
ncbi:ribosomal protein S18 acetylase RimI-like enzyme [Bacillus ectoiniformans]|uniref:GNAT family N-acetyltransferase n=1 Tax=Bacillus ectoiniformans TaxID=1494429 RepID=UPI00195CE5E4|nr:GNAT family N-acetyltransferase [Bacillus ectoiniformans]MBM7650240.1 ribosomal protein S18 acetylase RimI-like enzyme [Bacillus ectoiniformans]